jgi:Tol biopolymer transport system component
VKLAVVNVANRAVRVLPIPGDAKWPSWSPDGQWLYFSSTGRTAGIWKIRPAGGTPVQITKGADDDIPQPSADGKFLYYNKGWPGPFSVWRIPVDGGEETRILEGVSPRGEWTVGSDGLYFFATPDAEGRSELRMYDFANRRTKTILTTEHALACKVAASPGDRTLYYAQTDEHGSDLMLVENFR